MTDEPTQDLTGLAEPEIAATLAVLRRLVERGWTPPDDLTDLVVGLDGAAGEVEPAGWAGLDGVAVRSLAEDLAVARSRAVTAREESERSLVRVASAVRVSHDLRTDTEQKHARALREVQRHEDVGGRADRSVRPAASVSSVASLVRSATGQETISAVVRWALERAPAATETDEAAVSLTGNPRQTLSDGMAEQAEQLQVELGEGPTLVASTASRPVRVDLSRPSPWLRWSVAAARLGVGGAIAVPLAPAFAPGGVLTLYTAAPRTVDVGQLPAAEAAGALLSLCLSHAHHAAQLHEGMEHRTVIGQAQGLLMERFGIDAPSTFAILRRASSIWHRRVFDVATDLVRTRNLPPAG